MSEGTVEKKKVALPAYFDSGITAVFEEAMRRDTEHAHYWIKSEDANRQTRRAMGWSPLEDKETLKRLGLGDLIGADGRAHYMDTELWRMPREMQDAIHEAQSERQAQRSDAIRATLAAMGDDTKGRSKNAVVPYMGDPSGVTQDLITRERVAPPVAKK